MKSRILVVDDDQSILELLRFLLESEGYRVQAFHSASTALKAAVTRPPDAAVVDLMMPGMNGLELVQALRCDPHTQHVPVLICSAYYGDLRHITTHLKLNEVLSLRKPFQIQELLHKLQRMIAERQRDPIFSKGNGQRTVSHPVVIAAESAALASSIDAAPIITLHPDRRAATSNVHDCTTIAPNGAVASRGRGRRR